MSGENFLLLLRLGFSLSLVFGLMWVAARVVRGKNGALKRAHLDHLEVVERKPLTKNSSIAIVRVGGETLTVGITDNNVTLLGHVDLPPEPDEATVDEPAIAAAAPVVSLVPGRPAAGSAVAAASTAITSTGPSTGRRRSPLDILRDKTVRHIPG